jgi:hypothetical protein
MNQTELLIALIVGATAMNLPFGAWRTTTRKFSWKWFVSIHLPIPLVILLRIGLGFSWWYVPVSLSCAVTGQIVGGILYVRLRRRRALAAAEAVK